MVSVKGDVEKSVNMSVSSGNLEKTASVTVGAVPPHANELRQNFSLWSLASLCLCLVATWEALTSVVAAALTNGGAPCLFYNYILSFLGTIAVAVSLAEIASIYPTAGGQYHWVAMLAPKKSAIAPSWFTAWISIGGQIVLTASAAFAAGLQFQGLLVLNNPDYVPQRWQGLLFYWLVLSYSMAINLWGSRILPHSNLVAGFLHVFLLVVLMIVFGVLAPKHTASYVFVETSNTSGWENNGVSWLIGLVSTVYPFLGYDAAVHLSEEMENPSRNVPIAMVGSVIVNGILGFGYCLMLLFSLGDLNELLLTPTGFPFMQLFLNITNNNSAATFLSLFISITAVMANSAGLTATSRTAWAFARDSALPFSNYFTHISGSEHVPARMIVLVTILQGLVGLLYLGSYTAFNAVLSMAILGVYVSYLLPIVYMITYGRTADKEHPHGYFRLSKIGGTVVNTAAIVWLLIGIVFSTFPSYQPVTPENMNWSVVVMGGWMMCGAVYYCVWGRKSYNGPLLEVTGMVDAQQVKEISEK